MTVKEKLVKWEKKLEEAKLEYPAEDIKGFVEELKADGIILAFGMSDDLLEFSGALNEECGAWNGTVERLVPHKDGAVSVFDENENKETAELNRLQIKRLTEVRANWCPENEKKKYGRHGILHRRTASFSVRLTFLRMGSFIAGV
jgi:hypothetical protein